jgi:hypothetical protein
VGGISARAAARLAWSLCLLCVTLTAGQLLFNPLNGNVLREVLSNEQAVGTAILTPTFSIVGALIASRRPRSLIGWLLCCVALSQGLSLFAEQ